MQEPKHRLYIPVSGDQQQFPLTQHAAKTQGHWEEPEQHSALELQVSLHTPSISTVLDSCFRNHQIGLGSPYSLQNPQRNPLKWMFLICQPRMYHVLSLSQLLTLLVLQTGGREEMYHCLLSCFLPKVSSHRHNEKKRPLVHFSDLSALSAEQQKPFLRR